MEQINVSLENGLVGENICSICHNDMKTNTKLTTTCNHTFCFKCINTYYETGINGKLCPICRAEISIDKTLVEMGGEIEQIGSFDYINEICNFCYNELINDRAYDIFYDIIESIGSLTVLLTVISIFIGVGVLGTYKYNQLQTSYLILIILLLVLFHIIDLIHVRFFKAKQHLIIMGGHLIIKRLNIIYFVTCLLMLTFGFFIENHYEIYGKKHNYFLLILSVNFIKVFFSVIKIMYYSTPKTNNNKFFRALIFC